MLRFITYGLFSLLVTSHMVSEANATQEPVTIVALGDSLTAGYRLPPEDGLVPQLQSYLDEKGYETKIINAGVSGDTTAGGKARLEWSLVPEAKILIVTLGGNDLLRGLPIQQTRKNLEDIILTAKSRDLKVILVPIQAPMNYGSDFANEFNSMYPELASKHDVILAPQYFEPILEASSTLEDARKFMLPDGIHPNANGVTLVASTLGTVIIENNLLTKHQ